MLTSVADRDAKQRMIEAIRRAPDETAAIEAIAEQLDSRLGPVTSNEGRRQLYRDIVNQLRDNEPRRVGVKREDVYGAVALIVLAIFATLPVVISFLFIRDPFVAIRASNLIAIAMLFVVGYRWAKQAGGKPFRFGLLTTGIGVVLVLVATHWVANRNICSIPLLR